MTRSKLTDISEAQFPIPHDQIVWYSRQLKQGAPTLGDTNTDDYFTAWTPLGDQCKGVECTYTPPAGGIFQLKATLSYNGTSSDVLYIRKCDAANDTNAKRVYSPICKKGMPDYFGVTQTAIQIAIRNTAHADLGDINYAEAPSLIVPSYSGNSSFTVAFGKDKCNIFVYAMANIAGAFVPFTEGGNSLHRTSPPLAFDWYNSSYTIPGWPFLSSTVYPQPGFVVTRPDARTLLGGTNMGEHWAHVGILDYDGCWINAGQYFVNKYPHLTDPKYQPIGMRNYSGN